MTLSKVSLGLIGAGNWGINYINTINSFDDIDLVHVSSRNPSTAKLLSPDCLIEDDWHKVAMSPYIDGLIIASPPNTHADILRTAINSGIPVLVEKPLTVNHNQALEILNLAMHKQVLVMVNHIHLFHPAYRKIKNIMFNLNSPISIRSIGGNHGPFRTDVRALWDYAPHDISMCLDLLDDMPNSISAKYLEKGIDSNSNSEVVALNLGFANKETRVYIETGNLMRRKRRELILSYEKFNLIYSPLSLNPLLISPVTGTNFSGENYGNKISCENTQPLSIVIKEFSKLLSTSSYSINDLMLAVNVVKIIENASYLLNNNSRA